MACKENLLSNGYSDDQVKVVYKRPTDLALLRDVPISCNLCICDVFDDGLLSSGIVRDAPRVGQLTPSGRNRRAIERDDVPQAVEMRTPAFDGLSLDAIDGYRFHPTYLSGVDLCDGASSR